MQRLVAFDHARRLLAARCAAITETEEVALEQAAGRRLAAACAAEQAYPERALAAADGLAVRSADSVGASPYNPLPAGPGVPVEPGAALPSGADAVAPWESVVADGSAWSLLGEIDAGQGVCRAGQLLAADAVALEAGRLLRAADLALLGALDRKRVRVYRRPVVGVLDVGADTEVAMELLLSLLAADGAAIERWQAADAEALADALAAAGARVDLVIVVGGAGEGPSGFAPIALERAARLEAHGIALRPGRMAGVGAVAERPSVLVPQEPLAAQAVGELLVGPALRALSGAEAWPHRTRVAPLARKAVSALGELGYLRAAFDGTTIHLRPSGTDLDLPALARSDGFILVGPDSEGHPPGAEVTLYLDRC